MGRSQIINIKRSLEKLIPIFMDDFEWFKTSMEKVTADVAVIAKELELVEPKDVTELFQSCDKIWTDEELFLTDEQRK